VPDLTARQRQLLRLVAVGHTKATVRKHLENISGSDGSRSTRPRSSRNLNGPFS
jgi:hypothetical protein